jgi:hypothetical protein
MSPGAGRYHLRHMVSRPVRCSGKVSAFGTSFVIATSGPCDIELCLGHDHPRRNGSIQCS